MHDLALMCEIQAPIGLVSVPKAEKLPSVIFIPTLLRPQDLTVPTGCVREVKLDAGIDACDKKLI